MKKTLDSPQKVWQSQPVEGTKMSAEAIRLRAGKFERGISRRNLRETIIAVAVIGLFGYYIASTTEILQRLAWGLFIGGMIWITVNLHRRGTPRTMPSDMGSSSCLEFFRSELERQRDLIQNVWSWHLAPLVPGYLALNVAYIFGHHHLALWAGLALLNALFVGTFVGVWKVNQKAARCLQRSIDDLNLAESSR
jgi:hypothetical protein